ncbi:MAG: dockerin type I domain-containing protein [Dehalococcoidia bacterium]|nr:dockerin type I domain-containing protein [Dehalococcoidia bacterium]
MSRNKAKALAIGIIVSLVVLLMLPVSVGAELPGYSAGWRDFSLNPVLGLGAAGSWNESATGAASVILDGSTYKMWVTGFRPDGTSQIGYATSTDGKTWTPFANNPLTTLGPGASGSWNDLGVGSPSVIKDGSTYRMWYTGYANVGGVLVPRIGYASSVDGTAWAPFASNPIMIQGAAGTFTESGVMSPSVILDSGALKMWFTGRSAAGAGESIGTLKIGYATSTDATTWAPYVGNPVLSANPANSWETRGVGPATVVRGGLTYYMWYTGTSGTGASLRTTLNGATSSNGTTWNPSASNPLLSGATGTWTAMGVGSPAVVKQTDNLLRLYYSGVDATMAPKSGFAYSVDFDGQTTLQGSSRPASGRTVPITVRVFPQGTSDANLRSGAGALVTANLTTIDTGSNNVSFMLPNIGVAAGTYDITAKVGHALINVKRSVVINPPNLVSLGTLREGDSNNDGQINIMDFSLLAGSYLKSFGQAAYNSNADYDMNGQVNTLDFSLLAANYLKTSPQNVP